MRDLEKEEHSAAKAVAGFTGRDTGGIFDVQDFFSPFAENPEGAEIDENSGMAAFAAQGVIMLGLGGKETAVLAAESKVFGQVDVGADRAELGLKTIAGGVAGQALKAITQIDVRALDLSSEQAQVQTAAPNFSARAVLFVTSTQTDHSGIGADFPTVGVLVGLRLPLAGIDGKA